MNKKGVVILLIFLSLTFVFSFYTLHVSAQDEKLTLASRFSFNPVNPSENQPVTFDASTTVNNTAIQYYLWNFNNFTTYNTTNPTVIYSFPEAGNYNVSLTVYTIDENFDTVTQMIVVGVVDDFFITGVILGAIFLVIVAAGFIFYIRKINDESN